jgi:hypothetical protein
MDSRSQIHIMTQLLNVYLRQECFIKHSLLSIVEPDSMTDDVVGWLRSHRTQTQIRTYEYGPTALNHGSDKNFPLGSDNFTQS